MTGPDDFDRGREIDAELRDHFERSVEGLRAGGLDIDNARREAIRRFGDTRRWRRRLLRIQASRHSWRAWLAAAGTGAARDARHAARSLVRSPLFSTSIVALFALAASALTVALAVVNGVLLSDPPYPEASRLAYVWGRNDATRAGYRNLPISEPDLADWRAAATEIRSVGGAVPDDATLTGVGEPARLAGVAVIGDLFETLGVAPLLGRTLTDDDTTLAERPIVLGHALWVSRFGGDAGVVGRLIELDGRPHRIAGVMPAGFMFPRVEEISSVYGFGPELSFYRPWRSGGAGPPTRGNRYVVAIARLAEGASAAGAARQIETITAASRQRPAGDPSGDHFTVVPMKEQAIGGVRGAVWLIAMAVGGVVAIACLNVANLLLVRVGGRRHELAVRASLGAGRIALVRHAVFEAVLLSVAGVAIALPAASILLAGLQRLAPPDIPRLDAVVLDGPVVAAAVVISIAMGLTVGMLSIFGVRSTALHGALRAQGRGHSRAGRSGRLMVALEVAVSLTVAVAAVLLLRSFLHVAATPAGFETDNALTFQLRFPAARYRDYPDVLRAYDSVIHDLQAVHGVTSAAYTWQLPMGQTLGSTSFTREDGGRGNALIHRVSPGFFRTMGMRITRGRGLDSESDLPPVLINEALARTQWSGADPIGSVITLDGIRSRVTGIVNDIRQSNLEQAPAPEMYRVAVLRSMYLVVRTSVPPAAVRPAVADALRRIDPGVPMSDVRTFEERLSRTLARRRLVATGVGAFATIAALLALVGLYGVTAMLVAGRRREVAIRMALGSTASEAVALMVRQLVLPIGAGLASGAAGAWVIGRQMQAMLIEVRPGDPSTYVVTAGVLAAAALASAYLPARRAGRTNPAEALGAQ